MQEESPQPDSTAITALRKLAGNTVAWEEMPSFWGALQKAGPPAPADAAEGETRVNGWSHTQPADLLPPSEMQPFRETMHGGLSIREVFEPEVFRWFFGRAGKR
jgi:hypothetical protein